MYIISTQTCERICCESYCVHTISHMQQIQQCSDSQSRPANTAKTAMTMGKATSQRNSVENEKESLKHHMKGAVKDSRREWWSR